MSCAPSWLFKEYITMPTIDLDQPHLPLPGEWLGLLCEALAIKTVMNDKIRDGHPLLSTKMLQRYFRGELIRSREHIDAIHKLFVDTISSRHPGVLGIRKEFMLKLLKQLEIMWSELVNTLQINGHYIWNQAVKLTVARYLIPDLAIRVAVWLRTYHLSLFELFPNIAFSFVRLKEDYFSARALGTVLEIWRDSQGYDSWNALAQAHELDSQKLDQWRKGIHLPDHHGVDELSRIITDDTLDQNDYLTAYDLQGTTIQLWRGVSFFFRHMEEVCGEARTKDLTDLFRHVFYATYVCLPFKLGHDGKPSINNHVFERLTVTLYEGLGARNISEIKLDLREAISELHQLISSGMLPDFDMSWYESFSTEFELDLICLSQPERLNYWILICTGASCWTTQYYPCFQHPSKHNMSSLQDLQFFEDCDEDTQRQVALQICHRFESISMYKDALDFLGDKSKAWKPSAHVSGRLGLLLIKYIAQRGKYTLNMYYEAMDHIHQAMMMDPESHNWPLLMLRLLELTDSPARALVYVDDYISRKEATPHANLLRIYPLMALCRFDEVTTCMEELLKEEPYNKNVRLLKDLACLYTVQNGGKKNRARQLGLKLEKMGQDNPYTRGIKWSKEELDRTYAIKWNSF